MRNTISLPMWIVVVVGTAAVAAPPAGTPGKILILENERVLEGDVEKVGAQYRIRRALGETWVPADRVLAMCQDKEEGYRFLRGRTNLNDADEHLKLAQWCHLNGLRARALTEVEEAVKLRPDHRPSQHLLAHLRQAAATREGAPRTSPVNQAALPPPPPIDLTEEALGQFATRIQPILMNTCAGCHSGDRGGSFRLTRTYDATLLNRKALRQNLAAVLAQVNPAQPQASAFLTKSVSVHGNLTQSPLKNRQAVAYRTLEEWVRRAVEDNPQLRETTVPVRSSAVPRTPINPEPAEPQERMPPALPSKPEATAAPAKEAKPADPFDPADFNEQQSPEKPMKP